MEERWKNLYGTLTATLDMHEKKYQPSRAEDMSGLEIVMLADLYRSLSVLGVLCGEDKKVIETRLRHAAWWILAYVKHGHDPKNRLLSVRHGIEDALASGSEELISEMLELTENTDVSGYSPFEVQVYEAFRDLLGPGSNSDLRRNVNDGDSAKMNKYQLQYLQVVSTIKEGAEKSFQRDLELLVKLHSKLRGIAGTPEEKVCLPGRALMALAARKRGWNGQS